MFWIIETKEQLQEFNTRGYNEAFVEIISYHNNIHPALNKVSLVYIRPLEDNKGYIICIDHSETLSIGKTYVEKTLQQIDTLYTRDKKSFLYYFQLKKIIDISSIKYIETPVLPVFDIFYRQQPNKTDINKIIPLVKHYEVCEIIYNQLELILKTPKPEYVKFYNKGALAFMGIEKNGIKVNTARFNKHYELNNDLYSIENDTVYTHYNLNTTTRRPSNSFNGINFSALNKTNRSRSSFIPKNDKFIEIDISAYHPTLASRLINYTFDDPDIHAHFAKIYNVEYAESKEITFKQLYGGVFREYQHLEFFQKVQTYIEQQWKIFNEQGYIEAPISGYRFEKDKLEDMNPQKLFNYILQNLETSINIQILLKIHKILIGKKTQIVHYCYDSFLLDWDDEEEDVLKQIQNIFKEMNLLIKINKGYNYDF